MMTPITPPSDPLDAYPDIVAAMAVAVPRVSPPARLKERLDARLREFAQDREASFNLLSRPADRVRARILSEPLGRRRGRGRPLGRVVVSCCGREAAFFCWYLPPQERFALFFERRDGSAVPGPAFVTDGAGNGEVPYLTLPSGPPLAAVALRGTVSGETVLAARL
jgi:hypothetical protein